MREKDIIIEPSVSPERRQGMQPGIVPTGVRVTHSPTGIVAFCDHERSQLKNLVVAKSMIEAGLQALRFEI